MKHLKSACSIVAFCTAFYVATPLTVAQAFPGSDSQLQSNGIMNGATQVQYGRCRFWLRECRVRWGYGPRFRRCLARHRCL